MKKQLKTTLFSAVLMAINCLSIRLASHSANTACDWLYYQEKEPFEIKELRKF